MHKVLDPDLSARVRASFARQQAMVPIGADMRVVEPGYTEIHLRYKPEVTRQHGYMFAVNHGKKALCAIMHQTIIAVHGKKEHLR